MAFSSSSLSGKSPSRRKRAAAHSSASSRGTRAAVFSEGRVWKVAAPKQLFSDVAALNEIGLDAPFAAKLTVALKEKGVVVDNDYTVSDFVEKMLSLAKTEGVCTSSEGGHEHA